MSTVGPRLMFQGQCKRPFLEIGQAVGRDALLGSCCSVRHNRGRVGISNAYKHGLRGFTWKRGSSSCPSVTRKKMPNNKSTKKSAKTSHSVHCLFPQCRVRRKEKKEKNAMQNAIRKRRESKRTSKIENHLQKCQAAVNWQKKNSSLKTGHEKRCNANKEEERERLCPHPNTKPVGCRFPTPTAKQSKAKRQQREGRGDQPPPYGLPSTFHRKPRGATDCTQALRKALVEEGPNRPDAGCGCCCGAGMRWPCCCCFCC